MAGIVKGVEWRNHGLTWDIKLELSWTAEEIYEVPQSGYSVSGQILFSRDLHGWELDTLPPRAVLVLHIQTTHPEKLIACLV
jgi:hypothetical protein